MGIFLYIQIAKFNFLKFFVYPFELVAYILRYVLRIGFLLALWNVISLGLNNTTDPNSLLSYFLLSTGISDLVMSDNTNLGRNIRKAVQRGSINNIIIKPVNIITYFYAETVGSIGVKFILAIISIILGIIINPPTGFISYVLFIVLLIEAFCIAFAYNLFEGALSLLFTEVNGIKNAMHHITRVLSGQTIPFYFFSESVRSILILTPIPAMIFGPINGVKTNTITNEIIIQIISGFIWAVVLNYLVLRLWKYSFKKYDSAGS